MRIFNVEPLTEHGRIGNKYETCTLPPYLACKHTDYDTVGGISHAELLGRSNLLALVAGGATPRFPDRNGQYCVEDG